MLLSQNATVLQLGWLLYSMAKSSKLFFLLMQSVLY